MTFQHIPDQRSYALHQRAADILRENPSRLKEIHKILAHWKTKTGTQAEGWAKIWESLITELTVDEIAKLICVKSERMDFYRKSSPFACMLSDKERKEIISRYNFDRQNKGD